MSSEKIGCPQHHWYQYGCSYCEYVSMQHGQDKQLQGYYSGLAGNQLISVANGIGTIATSEGVKLETSDVKKRNKLLLLLE